MTQRNPSSNTVVIHIRVPSETKDVLDSLAAKDHRTLTSMMHKIIFGYIDQVKVDPSNAMILCEE